MATLSVGGQLVATNDTLSNGVQDNITRLGTVTTGTMNNTIGSSATFPAGHVIFTTPSASGTTSTTLSAAWTSTVVTTSITPNYSDSSILLFSNFVTYYNDNSGDSGVSFRIKKVHSGGTSYPTEMDTYDGSGAHHSAQYNNLATGDAGTWHTYTAQDPAVGVADSAVSYTIEAYSYNVSSGASLGGIESRWWIYLQEVKR